MSGEVFDHFGRLVKSLTIIIKKDPNDSILTFLFLPYIYMLYFETTYIGNTLLLVLVRLITIDSEVYQVGKKHHSHDF